ncbi:MAG TPA: deoxyribose-phosphate aldolase [Ignavibacteriaceae bacterium]|jgi:deoxyribose-phosphate aldolase|nr:MAG: Deoxyribose-phosphate aldolase 1 [Ignavibacteria bacterium ADurb.Bin266]OQY72690.1 MAG: deoxyribose-phosphate aldolase [Ignavibacteriales bacterium UTCHB2]HQF43261.1 deoxyribose-phosphate aldolase [Ignavibacteriaceae bacterium]HQI41828.1 deoxyribose-phosphate aldolase [Ignavibacteriaceae bacterium]HQJ46718.1 deoxyribose-phosphate aldolase [Ignavibacteriaceae bacterium]
MNLNELLSENNIKKILNDFNEFEKSLKKEKTDFDTKQLAGMIDHTLLKPEATLSEIKQLCEEAKQHNFASVCVNPSYVSTCFDLLKSSNVKVCTVIGFPLGATTTQSKFLEAEEAIKNGAEELDMVINIGRLKDKDYDYVFNDLKTIADLSKKHLCTSKVILETCLLTDEEKVAACLLAKEAGLDFVKTSTGFSKAGATIKDVALMKFVVGDKHKVKAAGGIRSYDDAVAMINAGANRLGASAGVKIISGQKSDGNY